MIRRVGRGCLLALRVVWTACLLFLAGFYVWDEIHMYRLSSQFEHARVCTSGEQDQCLSEERAVVREDGHFWDIRIGLDDNQRVEGLFVRSETEPNPGTRVVAQSWDGDIVAVKDPSTETVYRSREWPVRWEVVDFILAPLALLWALAAAPLDELRRLVTRIKSRRRSSPAHLRVPRPRAARRRRRRAPPASG